MKTNRRISFGFCIALASVLFFLPQPLFAGYTIDPGNNGATDVDPADPTSWTASTYARIGINAEGSLLVDGGSDLFSSSASIGLSSSSTGALTIDGIGSTWEVNYGLIVGDRGNGTLNITNGSLVRVGATLIIDDGYYDYYWTLSAMPEIVIDNGGEYVYVNDDSYGFINMTTGGMLALHGGNESFTLSNFLGLIEGDGSIRYWNESTASWQSITNATYGDDYTLTYHDSGDLAGYTVLTVGTVPEPSMILLVLTAAATGLFLRRRRSR